MAEGGTEKTYKVEELPKDSTARPGTLDCYHQDKLNWELKSAVREDDTRRVSELIQAGAEVNAASTYDRTSPLFSAIRNNNESIAKMLIDAGAEVNTTSDGVSYAIQHNNEGMVRLLIAAGLEVNKTRYLGQTLLSYAVQNDNESMVRLLVDAGADVNVVNRNWCGYRIDSGMSESVKYFKTPLFAAVQNDKNVMVQVLIDAGADVNITDNEEDKTALFYAVQQGNNEIVCALVKAGANVNCTDNDGRTPLFHTVSITAEKSALVVCDTLIQAGADVNIVDKTGETALFLAVSYRNLSLISALIGAGVDVNIGDNEKQTALFRIITKVKYFLQRGGDNTKIRAQLEEGAECIEAGSSFSYYGSHTTFHNILKALLVAGADINSTTGETALSTAVECGDYRSVRALIKAGADIEIKNFWGQTALFDALPWCYHGDFRFLDALIEADVDVNTQDDRGESPLFKVVKYRPSFDFSVVQRLIDAGADVNKTDNDNRTALFHFVTMTWPEKKYSDFSHMIDGLLNAGLDINKVDKDGKTVLHWAAIGDDVETTNKFIEAGADTNIPDNQGQTALFVTVMPQYIVPRENDVFMFVAIPGETEKRKIARALVEDGNADVNARDTLGRTPLFYAIGKSMSIITYLIENGANLLIRDNCGVNIVSFFIENCMVNQFENRRLHPSLPWDMNEVLDLFLQHGISRNAVLEAIINVVFCKTLLVASYVSGFSDPRNKIKHLFNILKLATEYITETQNPKKEIIDNILKMVQEESRDFHKFYECMVPDILTQLIELGANPNSADADGNTALHFATCLPLYGLPHETVMKICHQLDKFGVMFNVRNHAKKTPFLFCLSPSNYPGYWWEENRVSKLRNLRDVFTFLLRRASSAEEATSSGFSVFHFLLELFQEAHLEEEDVGILLSLFDTKLHVNKDTINVRENIKLNSPLHFWATLKHNTDNNKVDENTLKTILNHLLEYGANLNIINEDGKTPLHVCSSWTAITQLLDAGADPCVCDSLGRPPLLAAAESVQRLTHFLKENRLYFDVLVEPKAFWRSAIERGLDPWTVDKRGESVFSFLIKSDQFVLAQALVEVARDDKHLESETVAAALLNTICKDKSTRAHWKSNLAEIILKSVGGSIVRREKKETSPLHLCCLNIVENLDGNQVLKESSDKEVFWTIAKQLLLYGADGESCLDIAKTNPALKDLLTKPQDIKNVPLLIPWTSISKTSEDKLAKVARRRESKHIETYWYHNDHLASGSFGVVFAGINEKDGREVAIKRIEKRHIQRPEDKREITNLTALADCENIVRYLSFFEDENFCYVVLELMEGNLEDYLNDPCLDRDQAVKLCGNVMSGLKYLHSQDILHRDLKPGNILYKRHPKLCLKIADFGLSRRIDSAATTVYGTNAGTRCWIAPEVLKSTKASEQHSKESDIFSCGLVLYYILSVKAHPFAPADCTNKSEMQINNETEANIMNGKMVGWDNSLCPEAAHLLKAMLEGDESKRPSADGALGQPFFWTEEKKQDFLKAVGNQPEFECPRVKVTSLTVVENDLEASYGAIVTRGKWNDPGYTHMPAIHTEMMLKRKMPYDPLSTVELVRFIRNAIAHVSGNSRPAPIRKQLLEDFVFLEYFPNLVMEVFKAVTTHGWDQTRDEIKYAMKRK